MAEESAKLVELGNLVAGMYLDKDSATNLDNA